MDGELQPRVRAVAAPVRVAGDVVAALAVSGARFDLAAATPRVIQLANDLSADLSDDDSSRLITSALDRLIASGIRERAALAKRLDTPVADVLALH